MGKMLCKVCGYEGGPGEAECPQCGAPLWPVEAGTVDTSVSELTDEVYITTETKAKPKEKRSASPRRAHLCLAAGFLAVCLLVQGLGLWKLTGQKVPDWSTVWYGELVTPRGIVPLPDGVEPMGSGGHGPRQLFWGLGDSVLGLIDSMSGELRTYYYDGESVRETDWTSALLSPDNQVLFYVTDLPEGGQALFRRDERTGRVQELDRGEQLGMVASDVSGDALAYVKQTTGEDVQVLLWRRGAERPETPVGLPRYLGPGGNSYFTYNYSLGDQNFGAEESWYWAAVWDDAGTKTAGISSAFTVDRDVTELLYQDEAGAWRYENAAGEQARLDDLPRDQTLRRVLQENAYFDPLSMPAHVTDWVYTGSDGALYCLSKDLTVTNLSGTAAVQNAVMDPEGDQLVYLATEKGEAKTALYRVAEPLSPGRRIVRELAEDDVKAFATSPDGSAILAKVRTGAGKTKDATVYKLSVEGGPWETTEIDPSIGPNYFTIDGVQVMNGGGCWYLDDASMHKALHYRSPSGEVETKLTWTSLLSSTMYPAEPGAVTLSGAVDMDMELMAVSGDQALLRASASKWPKTVTEADIDDWIDYEYESERVARYWLLDKDGSMTELERLEVS